MRPSLHKALPAIELLYAAWEKASKKPCYAPFQQALEAALDKLNGYYEKTADSDAHIIAMSAILLFVFHHAANPPFPALDPAKKFGHFKKHWDADVYDDVVSVVQKKVLESSSDRNSTDIL
jgi:hypothetical protein